MARVDGKIALVTGGARGIGASAVRLLVADGAKVVVADILDKEGEALAAELGDSVRYTHLDVTDRDAWVEAVAVASGSFGGLDVLVNNAGMLASNPIEEFTYEQWDRIIDVNVNGVFNGMKAALPLLRESTKNPSIVNLSSIAGLGANPGSSGYVTSKFAVRGLTKAGAVELAPENIRVNSIHPGLISTDMTAEIDPATFAIPVGHAGKPDDIGHLVVYLASDESIFCTGAEFIADGGQVATL